MRVWLSAKELAARDLTVQDVEAAIRSRNVEIPAGRIESANREFTVRSLGELKTPEEFGDLVVANQGGQLVRLKDLARVELGPRGRAEHAPLQGHVGGGGRHRPPVQGQHGGRGRRDPRRAAPDRGGAAAGRHPAHRVRPVDLRQALDQRGAGDAVSLAFALVVVDHLRVPPEPAGHDHPRPRHPGVDHRRLRGDVLPRLLDQQPHAAGAHARHRHRGGRRDHRAGERLPAPGGAGRGPGPARPSTAPARSPSPSSRPRSRWWRCSRRSPS